MGTSKAQRNKVTVICKCGCGDSFYAFPVYRSKADGGGLRVPEYKRGHHPNCRKAQNAPAWNKGLKKGDHPSISRMGFQDGHQPFNDWSKINERFKTDQAFRDNWLANKKGQIPWNKDITKTEYPNGIASGEAHGNWKGGKNGIRDTSEYRLFVRSIMERDSFICTQCGDMNHAGRGETLRLEVHHIKSVCSHPNLIMSADNCVTLCVYCHRKTDNYGFKAISAKR